MYTASFFLPRELELMLSLARKVIKINSFRNPEKSENKSKRYQDAGRLGKAAREKEGIWPKWIGRVFCC